MTRELNIMLSARFKLPHFFLCTSMNLLIMVMVWFVYFMTTSTLNEPYTEGIFSPSRFQQFLIFTIPVLIGQMYVTYKFLGNIRRNKFRKAKNYMINMAMNLVFWIVALISL